MAATVPFGSAAEPMLAIVPLTWIAPSQSPVVVELNEVATRSGSAAEAVARSCRPSSGSNRRIMGPRPQARRRAAALRSWDDMETSPP